MGISLFCESDSENYMCESNETVQVDKNQDPTLYSCWYSKWIGGMYCVW